MTRFVPIRQCLVYFVMLLLALPLAAQTVSGTLEGTVTDLSGSALPGVTVIIRDQDTGLERVTVTNGDGRFSAPFLPIGRYRMQVELTGMGSASRENVPVKLNETTVQTFKLGMTASESITVSSDAPRINVSDAEIKQTMTSDEIMAKPNIATGNFLSLAETFAGFEDNPTSGQNNPTSSSGSSINFNGTGSRGATFQINGVNNDDSSENQNRQSVALASIKSFQVISNNFSSEFGRGYGAVVLVQTKSGTNNVDGELYDYQRQSKWNSKSFFSKTQPRPINHRYEYGLTVGFPIIRDTLFGYLSGDKTSNGGEATVNKEIPNAADLASPRLTLGNDTPANRAFLDATLARFRGNQPNNPSISSRGYTTLVTNQFPDNEWSARFDWNANNKNAVTGRYQRNHTPRTPGEAIIGEAAVQNNRQSNIGTTWTNILSSNTVQEVRFGLGLRSTNVTLASGSETPVIRFSGLTPGFGPIIGNAGLFPILRNQRDNQLVYNLSSVWRSNHTVKLGTDLRRTSLNDRADSFNRGFWTFTSNCGGTVYSSAYAALLAGCVKTFTKTYGPNYLENRNQEGNFYVQDDWRVRDNLTLNLGLRDEYVYGTKEVEKRIDYGVRNRNYVDPRLGFAYTPDWSHLNVLTGGPGKFSIRGGFGVFHGRVFQSLYSQSGNSVRFNPPNAASLNVSDSTNLADPTNGFVFTPGNPTTRVNLTTVDPHLNMPETHQWNLTFERQIFSAQKLRFSYIGSQGRNLLQYRPYNLPVSPDAAGSLFKVAADVYCAGTGQLINGVKVATTKTCPNAVAIADNEISLQVTRANDRRPDSRYGTNVEVTNIGRSWHHGGQMEWESGVVRGFQGRMTYTYSKTIDNGSEATFVGTGDISSFSPNHADYARGLSRYDTRHRATMNASYAIPFFRDRKGILGGVLGGWQVSTVVKLSSGTPFTVVDSGGLDIDFDGVADARPILLDSTINGRHLNDPRTSQAGLPYSAFRRATPSDRVEDLIGRNTFYTDGQHQVDFGLYKSIHAPLGNTVMLRAEMYNAFNRVQYGFPSNDFANAANFGRITSTNGNYLPRTYQFAVRLLY